jgi:hypothetical protein
VKVTLQESADPEIWRRLHVPADIRLDRFHHGDLRRVLAAPDADGHAEMLEWLGIERASKFDPAVFSAADATKAIAGVLIAWRP